MLKGKALELVKLMNRHNVGLLAIMQARDGIGYRLLPQMNSKLVLGIH